MARIEKEYLSLSNVGDGAIDELFQEELKKILENILDLNTESTKKRTITIKVTILPTEDRSMANMFVDCNCSMAPKVTYKTKVFIGRENGEVAAIEHKPKQLPLFDETTEGMKIIGGRKND